MASPNIKCQLTEWGLPPLIINWYKKHGVSSLFEWQAECLCKNDVLFGGNLVYSAPTSAGKTLVADFLLLKRVLEHNKKALVIEPYVALTREKAAGLKSMLYSTKARVGAFGGNYYTPGGMAAVTVAVCTIEKANNFINKLINENKLADLGIIVVDEIHYLGDDSRGYQLELLLTKILYHNSCVEKDKKIQIVGLSATIPNLQSVALWLDASLYVTSYRPVPLLEKIMIEDKIYDAQDYVKNARCQPLEVITRFKYPISKDYHDVCHICIESILQGHSILIFCYKKKDCELLSIHLSGEIFKLGKNLKKDNPHLEVARKIREKISGPKLIDVHDKLKKCPAGVDGELEKALKNGVAFHHAGLTSEEREIIEDGFKGGAIKVLTATSTLSSGVNLPARIVMIQQPTVFQKEGNKWITQMLDPTSYRQMIGRAGRKNMDTHGESILFCTPETQEIAVNLVKSSLGDINSSLAHRMIDGDDQPSGLKKAVLEVIANNTAKTRDNLDKYLRCTFWLACPTEKEERGIKQAIHSTINDLIDNKFIEELKPSVYRSTRLGKAVLASGLHPDVSLELLQDLTKARKGFCLLSDLHIIYQVTPIDVPRDISIIDWQHYSKVWYQLDDISRVVGELIGIDEVTIIRMVQGRRSRFTEREDRVYKRFWVALIINDLINEIPLRDICEKYRIAKHVVQLAQKSVAQFAGVMSIFCEELGYGNIAALMMPLESRINFSCQRDLLELVKLNITREIARTLYNSGYKNVINVATADKFDIEFIIRQTKPFKKDASFSNHDDKLPFLWVPELARNMTTLDYASHIVDLARNYVEIEYGIDLSATLNAKRKEEEIKMKLSQSGVGGGDKSNKFEIEEQPQKRGRLENDLGLWPLNEARTIDINNFNNALGDIIEEREEELEAKKPEEELREEPEEEEEQQEAEEEMLTRSKSAANFVLEYVPNDRKEINKFLDKWLASSEISINFKLSEQVNEPIGGRVLRRTRRKRTPKKPMDSTDTLDEASNNNADSPPTGSQMGSSQEGLELHLDIDNKKHHLTRLYASFGDNLTVYVVDTREALNSIKQQLPNIINQKEVSSNNQGRGSPALTKLYTQNIVLAYKVLYAAFGISQLALHNNFEWHSFDVAWWMISNCPNRGLNNRNSSLSLVAKTRWARKYHHFLHISSKKPTRLLRGVLTRATKSSQQQGTSSPLNQEDYLKMKDLVKSGKTAILRPLIKEILSELEKRNQLVAYYKAEIPSRLTMAQMMVHGMGLEMKSMKDEMSLYEELSNQLSEIAQKYYAKSNISLTNTRDVARVLYQDLDLKKYLLEHATNANISRDPTNGEVLNILCQYHPFPKMVQDFRKIGKALEALQAANTHARYNSELGMMRVFGHCDFWQLTGRVSMTDPDLFLINRNFSVVIPAHANRPEEVVNCAPRRCFVPSNKWILVAADYSQLELRLLAHFSNDKNLLDILNRSLDSSDTFDVFKTVASKVYKKPVEEITSENRQHAKQICYGIIYGMGNRTLSIQLGVSLELAEEFRQDFFNAFPNIKTFTESIINECAELEYVESLLRRRRAIEAINSDRSWDRSKAERVAVNTRIQSSASDIIKLAMQRVNEKILSNYEHNARLVLEMHDELIYEINPNILNHFSSALKSSMEEISIVEGLRVKLLVNLKRGTDWSNLEDFNIQN